ncbi:MAG: hypothetical protein AAB783_01485 [Patescibacteria group bacterium]
MIGMQKRAVILFVVIFLLSSFFVYRVDAASSVRDIFLKERKRFFELPGAEQLGVEKRVILKEAFRRTFERSLAALLRLENISSRLKKYEVKKEIDKDSLEKAFSKIAAADQSLLNARSAISRMVIDFENIFDTNESSDDPASAFRELRYSFGAEGVLELQAAHTALVEATLLLEGNYERKN